MRLRLATPDDAPAIAAIYNQGIEDRMATFETRLRIPQEIEQRFDGVYPIVVLETDQQQVIAFASTSVYRPRLCYAGKALVLGLCRTELARAWRGSPCS
jgi:L-amino acid N-acyltransferase YncA